MQTLQEFLNSEYYANFVKTRYEWLSTLNQDRYNRVVEYEELGVDGSTHGEKWEDKNDAWISYCMEHEVDEDVYKSIKEELKELQYRLYAKNKYDEISGDPL